MKKNRLIFYSSFMCICYLIVGWIIVGYLEYSKQKKGLTPFNGTINKVEKVFNGTFITEHSELHFIGVVFPQEITDLKIKETVENWHDITLNNIDKIPGPDLYWIISTDNKIVGQGDGKGVIHSWNGGVLVLGEFFAKSGQTYKIKILIGPNFESFIKVSPIIVVGVSNASTSIGLEWQKFYFLPILIFFGIIGTIFLFLIIKLFLKYNLRD